MCSFKTAIAGQHVAILTGFLVIQFVGTEQILNTFVNVLVIMIVGERFEIVFSIGND